MSANYWLVKTEPEEYSYTDLCNEKETCWDGIRNYTARNYLNKMQVSEIVCIYHTGKERAIIGLGEVSRAAYPDPKDTDGSWLAVDIKVKPQTTFTKPVRLVELHKEKGFENCLLLKISRLSVMPLSPFEFKRINELGRVF